MPSQEPDDTGTAVTTSTFDQPQESQHSPHPLHYSLPTSPIVSASTLYDRFFLDFPPFTTDSTSSSRKKDDSSLLPSYIMQLPFDSFRFTLTILLLVSVLSISATSNDLDGQLERRQQENLNQKRATSGAPSFRIGPAVYAPQKEYASSGAFASGVVIAISIILAGLMS